MTTKKSVRKSGKTKKYLKKDLDIFKEKLINLKEQLLEQIRDLSEDTLMKSQKDISGDISGYGLHMADVASDHYERERTLSLVSSERSELLEVEEALKRIEEKVYGICTGCGKLISKTRLLAVPFAKCCRKCQEDIDKNLR